MPVVEDGSHGIPPARRSVLGAVSGVAAVGIWAGWLVMMRLGVTTRLTAPDLAALRFGVAGLVLLPVVTRHGLALRRLGWTGFIAVVMGAGAPYALLVGAGLLFAPVAHASALTQGVAPLTVALLAAVTLHEELTPLRKVGLALILGGALVIGGIGIASVGNAQSVGHACFLGAAALWAGYTVAMRRARLGGLHAAAIAAVVSLFTYVPAYFALGGRLLAAPPADLIAQGAYQGVLAAAVSLTLYGRAVHLLGASSAGALIAVGPAMATLLAIPALGEWPTELEWLAIVVITAGVYLAGGGPLPRPAAAAK